MHVYLQRALRRRGGVLDRVFLAPNVQPGTDDAEYMAELAATHDWYEVLGGACCAYSAWARRALLYGRFYAAAFERRGGGKPEVWLKLDDDLVYIADGALAALVDAKLQLGWRGSREAVFVSANVVNHPRLTHVHQAAGRIGNWAISSARGGRPYAAQRAEPEATPLHNCTFSGRARGVTDVADWYCAAAVHEAFLADLRGGRAAQWARLGPGAHGGVYPFHAADGSALGGDAGAPRWSVNAFAFEPHDLQPARSPDVAAWLINSDEQTLSKEFPHRIGRPAAAVGSALVAHYSYSEQEYGPGQPAAGAEHPLLWTEEERAAWKSPGSVISADDGGLSLNVGAAIIEKYWTQAQAENQRD
eukprot:TRINITY_DN26880_c0_g1_i2.p1 TRINITY_DN26880_c0_g1~~TRINITY_DN26880_c0_g1_i2.p1  ORF type:complete len:360 (+),score=75.31 TRINITY_DN26880_c0_g1_i2:816-1895(+)